MTVLDDSAAVRTITTGVPAGDERAPDPVNAAIHLRPRRRDGVGERFAATDPASEFELTRFPRVATLVRSRRFQFFLILPNQIIFWLVIFVGILGTVDPVLNFGTAITWFVWFCLVFVLMVVVGRAWCAMCPFGGFAEWIQRRALWQRVQRQLGLGRKMPARVAQYGLLLSVASFLGLTFVEEYFNIAGPGSPVATSIMVLGIVATALAFFLVFERRTFCRYICPLSALIGSVGAMGSVAGFRTRDRDRCLECKTKDCMRGGTRGYGCPWYTWPGSADSNLTCGLCSECYKACPSGNVGLFVQKPLTSVVQPRRRRADVAWAIVLLWGLVLYQQFNATSLYAAIDTWLNTRLGFPHYPDPVAYLGLILAFALVTAGATGLIGRLSARPDARLEAAGNFLDRKTRFRAYFLPLAYGLIPVVGADYFARQLPKFFQHAPRLIPAVEQAAGMAAIHSPLYRVRLLSDPRIVAVQVATIAAGTLAALWSTWRISGRELAAVSRRPVVLRAASLGLVLACGTVAAALYVMINAAD